MRRSLIIGTSLTILATVIVGQAYSQGVDQEFEALPACDKLDAIAGTGKSVASYIAGSGFDDFAADVVNECPRHLVELGRAWEMMAADPNFDLFARLPACEKLNSIEGDGKSVSNFIENSGYDAFAGQVLENCPRHLEELGVAWQRINARGGPDSENPGPEESLTFDQLPRCQQLDVIDSTPGKLVADHIYLSGIDDYEFAVRNECNRHMGALEEAIRRNDANRVSIPAATPVSASNSGLNPTFESLAPCQKLDVVQGTGKSVPQYIADSGIDEFSPDINSMCTRHIGNLIEAQRIVEDSR